MPAKEVVVKEKVLTQADQFLKDIDVKNCNLSVCDMPNGMFIIQDVATGKAITLAASDAGQLMELARRRAEVALAAMQKSWKPVVEKG